MPKNKAPKIHFWSNIQIYSIIFYQIISHFYFQLRIPLQFLHCLSFTKWPFLHSNSPIDRPSIWPIQFCIQKDCRTAKECAGPEAKENSGQQRANRRWILRNGIDSAKSIDPTNFANKSSKMVGIQLNFIHFQLHFHSFISFHSNVSSLIPPIRQKIPLKVD